MSLNKPALKDIIDRMMNDVYSIVTLGVGFFRKSFLSVIIKANAAAHFLEWTYISNLAKQFFVTTVTDPDYFKIHGDDLGIKQKQGSKSIGNVLVDGTLGGSIPVGTLLTNNDGLEYKSTTLTPIPPSSSDTPLEVEASEIGEKYDLVNSTEPGIPALRLTFTTLPVGVSQSPDVDVNGILGGSNIERFDSWRNRMLIRKQNPTEIGRESDYIQWSLNFIALPITRVWVLASNEVNKVFVFFVLDDQNPIFPNPTQITQLQTELDTKKPITVNVILDKPIKTGIRITMTLSPNKADVRNNVTQSLKDLFRLQNLGETLLISKLNEAISTASGEADHNITKLETTLDDVTFENVPIADIEFSSTQLPILFEDADFPKYNT